MQSNIMKYQLKRIAGGIYRITDKVLLRRTVCSLYGNYPEFTNSLSLLKFAFFQKILGYNRHIPWPVHFTSKVTSWRNIDRGARVYPGASPGCYIQAVNGIIFGSNIRIAANVCIINSNHNISDYDVHVKQDAIRIGNNVWIGCNSVLLPAVRIGNNVINGAGSVVSSDITDNSIAVGNPCRVVKGKPPYIGNLYD